MVEREAETPQNGVEECDILVPYPDAYRRVAVPLVNSLAMVRRRPIRSLKDISAYPVPIRSASEGTHTDFSGI